VNIFIFCCCHSYARNKRMNISTVIYTVMLLYYQTIYFFKGVLLIL